MTDPTMIVLADGTTVPLIHDHPHGWYANHDGTLIHLTAVSSSRSTATPAKARMTAPSGAEYAGRS